MVQVQSGKIVLWNVLFPLYLSWKNLKKVKLPSWEKYRHRHIIYITSNLAPVMFCFSVKRFSQAEKEHSQVSQQNFVLVYIQQLIMGGVNRSDQNMSLYSVKEKGKVFSPFCSVFIQLFKMYGTFIKFNFENSSETKRGTSLAEFEFGSQLRYGGINHLFIKKSISDVEFVIGHFNFYLKSVRFLYIRNFVSDPFIPFELILKNDISRTSLLLSSF